MSNKIMFGLRELCVIHAKANNGSLISQQVCYHFSFYESIVISERCSNIVLLTIDFNT